MFSFIFKNRTRKLTLVVTRNQTWIPRLLWFLLAHCVHRAGSFSGVFIQINIDKRGKPYNVKYVQFHSQSQEVWKIILEFTQGRNLSKNEVCSVSFAQAWHLKNYSRIHLGEKPNKCEVCSSSFTKSGNFKSHSRVHTGENHIHVKYVQFHLHKHSRMHSG